MSEINWPDALLEGDIHGATAGIGGKAALRSSPSRLSHGGWEGVWEREQHFQRGTACAKPLMWEGLPIQGSKGRVEEHAGGDGGAEAGGWNRW